ncbi:MAG: hypothetical protein ABJA85_03640 [Bacteroidota bacterium]
METTASRQKWLSTLALLLVLPTVYFIAISILKYNFGIDGPYDTMLPCWKEWASTIHWAGILTC